MDSSQEDAGENYDIEGSPAVRPNLAKALQFTTLVKTAEEKAALRAQQLQAQMRKASVLNRKTVSPKRGGTLLNRARSPSMALSPSRRPSSRPSISAGAGDNADATEGSPSGNNARSPSKASLLRKSSSASAAGMLRQDSQRKYSAAPGTAPPTAVDGLGAPRTSSANNRGSVLMHSPLRKSSSASGLQIPGPAGGALLRKSSSVSAIHSGGADANNPPAGMQAGVTGKFSGARSAGTKAGTIARLSSAVIHEEGSFDSEGFSGENSPVAPVESGNNNKIAGTPSRGKKGSIAEPVTASAAVTDKRGSVLRKSSTAPLLGGIAESSSAGGRVSTANKGTALPSVGEVRTTPSLSVKVPGSGKTAPRLSLLPPQLAEGSVSSSDSKHKGAKKKKHRKQSAALTEESIDNTTVSLALASPPQSADKRKQSRKPSTAPGKGMHTANTDSGVDATEETAPKSANKKKRGSTLLAEKGATTSSVVTRLPPVQGNVRMTRRKDD
jgi:hypothetical protein